VNYNHYINLSLNNIFTLVYLYITRKDQKLNDNKLTTDNWRKIIKSMYVLLEEEEQI